jgi:SAM-dependent methyltransferase
LVGIKNFGVELQPEKKIVSGPDVLDPIQRFSNRVENYSKYRPGYPSAVLSLLKSECGLTKSSKIADIGSGTGLSAKLFLENDNTVFGVEPNDSMRAQGEALLKGYPNFVSVFGTAESTTLESASFDFITAGQAFHWFDQERARKEFVRIMKPEGWIALMWNERRIGSTPFLRTYEEFLIRYGTDYQRVRHENVQNDMHSFFAPQGFEVAAFENIQEFDLEGLRGRFLSSSYIPSEDSPNYIPMLAELAQIFQKHQQNDRITIEYDTKVFYGHLR